MLHINNITKKIARRTIVNNVSITLLPGELTCIVGPNGAGKSTLLSIIMDLSSKSSGSIEKSDNVRLGGLVGFPIFYDHLSAEENLEIVCRIKNAKKSEITRVLELVNLLSERSVKYDQYSTGMKQRLGIAGALIGSPNLLILDEPTSGLDILNIENLCMLIYEMKCAGTSFLIVTHSLDDIESICDNIVVLVEGSIRLISTKSEFLEKFAASSLQKSYNIMLRSII